MQVNGNGFLARVEPRASCALNATVGAVWAVLREWGCCSWLQEIDGRPLRCSLVEGGSNTSVGAVRMVEVGAQRMFEKLIALDEDEHTMKWQVISHQDTINPFQASLVNYICTLKLLPITVGDNTFIDWRGELFTEVQHTMNMKATLERWYLTGFQYLQEYIAQGSYRPSQKHYGAQMGSLQSSPFMVTSTSPRSGAVGIMGPGTSATPSMYVGAAVALPRSLSSGRSMESNMSGQELLSPQKLGGQMGRQQEEAMDLLCLEQALGRSKNASMDSDVMMGRSLSAQLPMSRRQSLERGGGPSLPLLSAEQPALPGSNSNSGSASGERELDGDTLNSLIAGGRSGTLSRAELRAQLSGLYRGPVTREEIQLLEMLRDARTPGAAGSSAPISSGDGSGASPGYPGTADMLMARSVSIETAAGSSLYGNNPGSRRSSEDFTTGSKNMLLESHPIHAPRGRDAHGKIHVPSAAVGQDLQSPAPTGLTRAGSDTKSTSSAQGSVLPACMDVWHSEPVRR